LKKYKESDSTNRTFSNLSNDAFYLLRSMRKAYAIVRWLFLPAILSFIGIVSILTTPYDDWGGGFFITGIFLEFIIIESYKSEIEPTLNKVQIKLENELLYKIKADERITYLQQLLKEYKTNSAYSLLIVLLPLIIACISLANRDNPTAFLVLLATSVLVICTKYVTPIALVQKCIKNEINEQLTDRSKQSR